MKVRVALLINQNIPCSSAYWCTEVHPSLWSFLCGVYVPLIPNYVRELHVLCSDAVDVEIQLQIIQYQAHCVYLANSSKGSDTQDRGGIKTILMYLFGLRLLILQNVMTSEVLHSSVEATYITVETASFYGVKQKPSRVLVNSQDAVFTYSTNKVSSGVDGQAQKTGNYCHAWISRCVTSA